MENTCTLVPVETLPAATRRRSRVGMLVALVVAGVFLLMLASVLTFVARNALNLPFYDEWANVPVLAGEQPLTWHWLWLPHNEHRILLPRLLYLAVAWLAHGDFRAACYVNVSILTAATASLLWAIRQARGRWSLADAFFPLLLLSPAHFENLLSGFQAAFLLPVAILAGALALIASPKPWNRRRVALLAVGAAMLPLCGTGGLLFAGALLIWLLLAGAVLWRERPTSPKIRGMGVPPMFLAAASLVASVIIACSAGLAPTLATATLRETLHGTAQCLATAFGPPTLAHWPWHARAAKAPLLLTAALLTWKIIRTPHHSHDSHERLRAAGLLAILAGALLVALAIGYGRTPSGEFWAMAPRYASWMALIPICAFYTWSLYGPAFTRWLVPLLLALATLFMLPTNLAQARDFAQSRRDIRDAIIAGTKAGRPPEALGTRYADLLWLFDDTDHVIPASGPAALRMLASHHLGIFKNLPLIPAPDLTTLHPTDLPLTPASTNQIEPASQDARPFYRGTGTDPYLVFHLAHPQYVTAIRLTFTLDNPRHANPLFQCFWMDPPRIFMSMDRSFTQVLPPGPHEITLYPCDQISQLRLDPDIQPCDFHLTRITLLTP